MKIRRKFTSQEINPFEMCKYKILRVEVKNSDGSSFSNYEDAEVPDFWSENAGEILATKYFRKAGVCDKLRKIEEEKVPQWLQKSEPDSKNFGRETSVKQIIHRITGCWTYHLFVNNYFDTEEDAKSFYDEMTYMMLFQYGAPNSPQWFNTGLYWAYGIKGDSDGHWRCDHKTGELIKSINSYEYCQPHACFILNPQDSLLGHEGIMDTWKTEARIFKHGSGSGANFSKLRAEGELLSGGGQSSGVMSWLKIGDTSAGAIKSGGTTRRAATLRKLNIDHPDILKFITWKKREEDKAWWLHLGSKGELPLDFNGEIYQTISGQNSNNTIGFTKEFMDAYFEDKEWQTIWRTTGTDTLKDGSKAPKYKAKKLMEEITKAVWRCADPGIQFNDIINEWNPIPKQGEIQASNPCGEFMSINNSACNLAALNLAKFSNEFFKFEINDWEHAVKLWTLALEASIVMAQFPTKEIANNTWKARSLGLGYSNLGALLMRWAIPYDSSKAEAVAGAITATMTGYAFAMSAEMARQVGPFDYYNCEENKNAMLKIIWNHKLAAYVNSSYANKEQEFEQLTVKPKCVDHLELENSGFHDLSEAVRKAWDEAYEKGKKYGYRNSQATLLAPTGTVSFVMDCDTTGIEPDFALVKHKKLAGGGSMILVNQSVIYALDRLQYSENEKASILKHINGNRRFSGAPKVNYKTLEKKGLLETEIMSLEKHLIKAWHFSDVFSKHYLGEETYNRLKIDFKLQGIEFLKKLGFTNSEIKEANNYICGFGTIEGSCLKEEHLSIFDCSIKPNKGKRYLNYMAHVRMMSSAQAFLSGAISKTINMPEEATPEEIEKLYIECYKYGLKGLTVYRDNCKYSQPLNISSVDEEEEEKRPRTEIKTVIRKEDRVKPQDICNSKRFKLMLGRMQGYMHTGEYPDGSLAEVFLTFGQRGSTFEGMCNLLAKVTSLAIQYGVPVLQILRQYEEQYFEPSGFHKEFGPIRSIAYLISMYIRKFYGYPIPKYVPELIREKIINEQEKIKLQNGEYQQEEDSLMQELINEERILEMKTIRTEENGIEDENNKEDESNKEDELNPIQMVTCHSCGMLVPKTTSCFSCPICGSEDGCGDGAR